MAKDPVCGMTVDEKTAKFKSDYMGTTYYFCSQTCKTSFDKNPTKIRQTHKVEYRITKNQFRLYSSIFVFVRSIFSFLSIEDCGHLLVFAVRSVIFTEWI